MGYFFGLEALGPMLRTQQNLYDTHLAIECSKAHIVSLCASVTTAGDQVRKSKALVEAHRRSKALDEAKILHCAPDFTGSEPYDHAANLRLAQHLVEALQAAGYICELSPGVTVH
jgi:hypothetical protein